MLNRLRGMDAPQGRYMNSHTLARALNSIISCAFLLVSLRARVRALNLDVTVCCAAINEET